MPLACNCEYEDYGGPCTWPPDDYSIMPQRKRRAACASCGSLIDSGTIVAKFYRSRDSRNDVEYRIYGEGDDAVPLAPWYLCERCADLYWSLTELNFCVSPDEDMRDLARQYAALRAAGIAFEDA